VLSLSEAGALAELMRRRDATKETEGSEAPPLAAADESQLAVVDEALAAALEAAAQRRAQRMGRPGGMELHRRE
jgi:hypothetical protein